MYPLDLLWEIKGLCKAGVPSLWDLMPDDLRWSWCNNNDRNKVHNKCVLESSQIHPHSQGHGKTVCYKSSPWCQNGCELLIKGLFLYVLGGLPEDGQQLLALLEAPPNEENCPAWRGCIQRWSSAGFSRSTPLNPTQIQMGSKSISFSGACMKAHLPLPNPISITPLPQLQKNTP